MGYREKKLLIILNKVTKGLIILGAAGWLFSRYLQHIIMWIKWQKYKIPAWFTGLRTMYICYTTITGVCLLVYWNSIIPLSLTCVISTNKWSHEKALTEKGLRKRIMEKASTPLTEKAKNPWHGQESQRLGTLRKKTFTRVKNHWGLVLWERKPLQGPRISKARVLRKKLLRGGIHLMK